MARASSGSPSAQIIAMVDCLTAVRLQTSSQAGNMLSSLIRTFWTVCGLGSAEFKQLKRVGLAIEDSFPCDGDFGEKDTRNPSFYYSEDRDQLRAYLTCGSCAGRSFSTVR